MSWGGPAHALVYLSTWQAVHGGLARYRPSSDGWPSVVNEDFEKTLLPEITTWAGTRDVVEALLAQRVPPNRGVSGADHATAAWRLSREAGLDAAILSRAVEFVSSREWSAEVADHLEWYAERFGMPIMVRHEALPAKRWWSRR